jgi:hypothetical protein
VGFIGLGQISLRIAGAYVEFATDFNAESKMGLDHRIRNWADPEVGSRGTYISFLMF